MQLSTSLEPLADLPDRLCLPMTFDARRLARDMSALQAQQWTPHFVPQHFRGNWSVLPLRFAAGAAHPIQQITSNPGTSDWEDGPLLAACPYFADAMAQFCCPLLGVRIMRLTAGSQILPHRDADLSAERGYIRLHIPVQTNPLVDFRLNDSRVEMAVGSCWYLRLSGVHSVTNHGCEDRIHLVIDAQVNDWLAALLLSAARTNGTPFNPRG